MKMLWTTVSFDSTLRTFFIEKVHKTNCHCMSITCALTSLHAQSRTFPFNRLDGSITTVCKDVSVSSIIVLILTLMI